MEAKYNAKHAREILEPCGVLEEFVLLDDRGVWPAVDRDILMQAETEGLRWQPADELEWKPGAPDIDDTPMLPLPFTARELTAFMLAGSGALVSSFYGDWNNGPDQGSLNNIDPKSGARRALVEAFAAYRLAQENVGALDLSAQTRRDAAHKAYWREPSNTLLKEFDEAQKEWDVAYQTWLNSMVRELLASDSIQSKTEPQSATPPAPAGTAKVWTPKRKEEARAMLNKLRADGVRDFAKRTAESFDVSTARLNVVLGEGETKAKPKERASYWPT